MQETINFSVRLSRKDGFCTADIISERAYSKKHSVERPKIHSDLFANVLFVFYPGLFCFTLKYSELVEIIFLACSSYIFFCDFCNNNNCELEKTERKILKCAVSCILRSIF